MLPRGERHIFKLLFLCFFPRLTVLFQVTSFYTDRQTNRQTDRQTHTAWCSEIGSLTSLDPWNSGASSDVRKPISLLQVVHTVMQGVHLGSETCPTYRIPAMTRERISCTATKRMTNIIPGRQATPTSCQRAMVTVTHIRGLIQNVWMRFETWEQMMKAQKRATSINTVLVEKKCTHFQCLLLFEEQRFSLKN